MHFKNKQANHCFPKKHYHKPALNQKPLPHALKTNGT